MANQGDYIPPASTSIAARQNEDPALRYLIVQRRQYTTAKRWQSLRWIGLLLLGAAAPFVSVLSPQFAVAAGAITGAWLFIGRTGLGWAEAYSMTRAATIQELFDQFVFQMPRTIERKATPTLEDIVKLAGPDERLREAARKQRLLDWYPVDVTISGAATVAIAQRANAAYTYSLIRNTVVIWAVGAVAWLAALIAWSVTSGLQWATILLGVIFPVLPAILDVFDYIKNTWRASRDRADLASTIEGRLKSKDHPVEGQDLLVWQDHLFDLRRTTPQVPNWLYKITRRKNEDAMNSAAKQLGDTTR